MTDDNVFGIESPQEYRCNVFRYHSGLSRLYIRVFKGMTEAPSFYVFFTDVGYFEGPMNWKNVLFKKAPANECLDLMLKVGMVEDFMLDDIETRQALAEAAQLYYIDTDLTRIKIIAGSGVLLEELPEEIK